MFTLEVPMRPRKLRLLVATTTSLSVRMPPVLAAEAAAGGCDHCAGLRENVQGAVSQGFPVDLAAGRSDDQFDERRGVFALEDRSRCLQVLEASVGAGADEDLIHADTAVFDKTHGRNDASFLHSRCF